MGSFPMGIDTVPALTLKDVITPGAFTQLARGQTSRGCRFDMAPQARVRDGRPVSKLFCLGDLLQDAICLVLKF